MRRIFRRRPYNAAARGFAGMSLAVAFGCTVSARAAAQSSGEALPPAPPPAQQPVAAEITVTAPRITAPRQVIAPSVGASSYALTNQAIQNLPGGENASLSQVLLQAPGVAQDNMANGAIHIRNEHLSAQYRINGVMLPEGVSFFGEGLSPRFVQSMNLITGALPAQYGLRTSGVVDITTKNDFSGGSVGLYGGTYWTLQPSFDYGGHSDGYDYFFSGDFLHNRHGINSPVASYDAVHDNTNQVHGFGYVAKTIDPSTKLSAMVGSFAGRYQIPNNPGQPVGFTVSGSSAFDSNALDENQDESSNFGVLSYNRTEQNFDLQVSGYTRYSTLHYFPDIYGDLAFDGIAQYALRQDFTNGIQADTSYKLTSAHTLRSGVIIQAERSSADTTSWVEQCNASPCSATNVTSDTPFAIVSNAAKTGWTYGTYLQDEWKLFPSLTINYGGRFDAVNTSTMENQISPRINAVWNATATTTVHAGYAKYFTPPPFDTVTLTSINTLANTTGAPPSTGNSPVKAERSHYFDLGVTQEVPQVPGLRLGIDAYYKYARNLLDEGQFGAPIILTPFNYHVGYTKGIELSTSYDRGPFSYYGNLAIGTEKAEGISSAQFNFSQADLDYIDSHLINTDHSQLMTASAGVSYNWRGTVFSVDLIAGTGVRTQEANNPIPNGSTVPSYEQVNFGVSHRFDHALGGPIEVRFDLINVFDEVYLIREQSGIGVFSPQYGPRRTFYMGVRKYF